MALSFKRLPSKHYILSEIRASLPLISNRQIINAAIVAESEFELWIQGQ